MDYLLITISFILLITGIIGSVLPVLPGPPISWLGLLLVNYTRLVTIPNEWLIGFGIATVIINVLDFYIPIWGTKKFGGTQYGVNGSTIGLILGLLFFPPFGIIFGPFLGAMIGEFIHDGEFSIRSIQSAFGSLIGFLIGTGLKLALTIAMLIICIKEIF